MPLQSQTQPIHRYWTARAAKKHEHWSNQPNQSVIGIKSEWLNNTTKRQKLKKKKHNFSVKINKRKHNEYRTEWKKFETQRTEKNKFEIQQRNCSWLYVEHIANGFSRKQITVWSPSQLAYTSYQTNSLVSWWHIFVCVFFVVLIILFAFFHSFCLFLFCALSARSVSFLDFYCMGVC